MKVSTVMFCFIAILMLLNMSGAAKSQGDSTASAKGELWVSPVNTGDCVAPRIFAKRTIFIDKYYKDYCDRNKPDETKVSQCIENTRHHQETFFFTDRCSADEYFIGINGKEVRLKRISKKPAKPINFIGSFAGDGVKVEISHPRLIQKTYFPNEPRTEENVLDASYKVLVTIRKGALKKSFNGVLSYGR